MPIDSSSAFLLALREAPWDLAAIVPDDKIVCERLGSVPEIDHFIGKWNNIANIYYCPNPQKIPGVKAKKEDIEAACYLQSDLDPNDDETQEDAKARYLRAVAAMELTPTLIVDSGNGLQVLWRLKQPSTDFARVESLNKALCEHFGGPPGTHNLDRILRVPFTINWPNAKKRRVGRVKCIATLVAHDPEAIYDLESFDSLMQPSQEDINRGHREETKRASSHYRIRRTRPAKLEYLSGYTQELITMGPEMGADRSAALFHVISDLRLAAWTPQEMFNVLVANPKGVAAHCFDNGGKDQIWRQIDRCLAKHGNKPVFHVIEGEAEQGVEAASQALLDAGVDFFIYSGTRFVCPVPRRTRVSGNRETTIISLESVSNHRLIRFLWHSADFAKWKTKGKDGYFQKIEPPEEYAKLILSCAECFPFRPLRGLLSCPTLRPDGTVLKDPGYDVQTRLYLADPPRLPQMPESPTREDALHALATLRELLREFPFADGASESVALSAILAAVVRGKFPLVPIHAVTSPTPRTGKSFLLDTVAHIASGSHCPAMRWPRDDDEQEKRLTSVLLAGYPLVSIDNVHPKHSLGGDMLCQVAERPVVVPRILGRSETPRIEPMVTVFATGNNLKIEDDLVPRTVVCKLDAKIERPELREFRMRPLNMVMADRGKYIAAALTIVRAYICAGRPGKLNPLASYEAWSDDVRSALVWLDCADPVMTQEEARADDPTLDHRRAFLWAWVEVYPLIPNVDLTTYAILDRKERTPELTVQGLLNTVNFDIDTMADRIRDLHEAMMNVASVNGKIDPAQLGRWLGENKDRPCDGLVLRKSGMSKGKQRWYIEPSKESSA